MSNLGYIQSGITANLLVIGTATALSANSAFHQVGTCTSTNNAVLLPASANGTVHTVRNDGVAYCQVFPPDASGVINSQTAGLAFFVAAGGMASFVNTGTNQWYTFGVIGRPVIPLTATQVLTNQYSGCDILVSPTADTILTLPAIANSAGQNFLFRVNGVVAHTITIRGASACIQGTVINAITAAVVCVDTLTANHNTDIIFANSSPIGSMVALSSDGTNWHIDRSYNCLATAGFTLA